MSVETRNQETISRASEARLMPTAVDLAECQRCEGWGVVLGTDTEDSYGAVCECGRAFDRPRGAEVEERLAAAHARARAAVNGIAA